MSLNLESSRSARDELEGGPGVIARTYSTVGRSHPEMIEIKGPPCTPLKKMGKVYHTAAKSDQRFFARRALDGCRYSVK